MKTKPEDRKHREITIPLKINLLEHLVKTIISIRKGKIPHKFPLLLQKDYHQLLLKIIYQIIDNFTLNKVFEIDKSREFVADLLACFVDG